MNGLHPGRNAADFAALEVFRQHWPTSSMILKGRFQWQCLSLLAMLLCAAPVHSLEIEQPSLASTDGRCSSIIDVVTTSYGGTTWAADSLRWEAIRDSSWTFDSGVGSSINTGGNPNKPLGYHQQMEGWIGMDQTLPRLGSEDGVYIYPYFKVSQTCAINGTYSAWAGFELVEANILCLTSGQGYSNGWNAWFGKSFLYPAAGGSLNFSYDYNVHCEPGFDYAYVIIDPTGNPDPTAGTAITLASYTGARSGTGEFSLSPNELPAPGSTFYIWFHATSNGSGSDEDGAFPTSCGLAAFDDINLSGAIFDSTDFDLGLPNGWKTYHPASNIGDYSNLVDLSNLSPPATFCPCAASDSVLVFFDESFGHPMGQDNIAASPWINLNRTPNLPDLGRPVKLLSYSIYAELPIANYVFVQLRARYYPEQCPFTGLLYRTPWLDQGIALYYGEEPFCNAPGTKQVRDYSSVIGLYAEQIQVAFGVIDLCRTSPFGFPCSGLTNTSPWFDDISLDLGGSTTAQSLTLLAVDTLQDAFAQDGTLNPSSVGRFDTSTIKDGTHPGPGAHLGDTMVVRTGSSTNTEVRAYFRLTRVGPFTNVANLAPWQARWTPANLPGNPGWYCARMDTAEQGGVVSAGKYMMTFHESDPGFLGTDRSADGQDANQLANEILPDKVLTPGTRIDYFLAARYIPPDPRNAGGMTWFLEQDTTGDCYREVEILPTSTGLDTSWNCILYVDHHDDRAFDEQVIEEQGLTMFLGGGGNNAEQTRYDRWDVQTPTSGQLSFGRPIQTNFGCSAIQAFAYQAIVWHCAMLSSFDLTEEDANILQPWLSIPEIGNNRFWGSGDGFIRSMSTSQEPQTMSFMTNILGVQAHCNSIRDANCPSGTDPEPAPCLELLPASPADFNTFSPVFLEGNGCSGRRSFDLNSVNTSVLSARGQLHYKKLNEVTSYASVTNYNTVNVNYRTVADGFAVGTLRGPLCTSSTPALTRTADVLTWFAVPQLCRVPTVISDTPEDRTPSSPKYNTGLSNAAPNPMSTSTMIHFENARDNGHIRIEIINAMGQRIRTLVDAEFAAGTQSALWDGRNDSGRSVAAGLYFYRLTSGSFVEARKILVVK